MHFRWSTKAYALMRPMLGHRASMWISDMLPVALFAGLPLLAFVVFFYLVPVNDDGSRHQSCGSGPGQYDC
jgi:hypothetical protein